MGCDIIGHKPEDTPHYLDLQWIAEFLEYDFKVAFACEKQGVSRRRQCSKSKIFASAGKGKFDSQAYFGLVELKLIALCSSSQTWAMREEHRLRIVVDRREKWPGRYFFVAASLLSPRLLVLNRQS